MEEGYQQIIEEYENNQKFKKWVIRYCTKKDITFDEALKDPTVKYAARYWNEQRATVNKS